MESTAVIHEGTVARVRSVYETDHARLWRSLYAFSGSRSIADDAAAEAFAQALRRGDEIRDVAAWVWRAAYAIARGELQRRGRADGPLREVTAEVASEAAEGELSDLMARLRSLPESDRELLVLCHVGGWKPRELAPVLGVPAGAIRVRLHRATQRARAVLSEEDR